ncbi:MAG: substrate-binding domain-containing protein [Candidatus Amulumruptor caecigallinarius]|nr:substrate-binding domain-containing protein [Candidatus Amulumruptor caecigallinarius]MCM1396070.1 substrate-binding domain-containing protein [Candidatus Amulumruptor caecigallinarius]MCM1453921.1 substrate-binding domain-containing protein [bacterium]
MKITASFKIIIAAAAVAVAMTACDKKVTNTSTSGIGTVVCDASFENILDQEIDVFEYVYPKASIIPYYVDEKAAVDSLLDLKTKAIIIARPLTRQEKDYLKSKGKNVKESRIAVDALALIVNPENPCTVLSKEEIAEILTGKYTKWDQIVPNKGLGNIEVVFDHQGSSTVQYMRDSLINGADFGPNVYAQKNNEDVFRAVAANKNAIGVIGVSWISADLRNREVSREELAAASEKSDTTVVDFDPAVKVIKVRGNGEVTAYKPYQAYIFDGSYPLYRSIYMVNVAAGGSIVQGFYSFVTSVQGQKIIQMTGILPATVYTRMVSLE